MDVSCERCSTQYEFDDALVSERGTTVECTNCGHKFKVYPPQRGRGAAERWQVRTVAGRQLVYTSLRDLQKGIARGQVGPDDQLSREDQPSRPLGSIAELEPFFRSSRRPARHRASRTLSGVAPPPNAAALGSSRPVPPWPASQPPPAPPIRPQRVLVAHPAVSPHRPAPEGSSASAAPIPTTIREAPAPAPRQPDRVPADQAQAAMPPRAPDLKVTAPTASQPLTPSADGAQPAAETEIVRAQPPPEIELVGAQPHAGGEALVEPSPPSSVDVLGTTRPVQPAQLELEPATIPRGLPPVQDKPKLDRTLPLAPNLVAEPHPLPDIRAEPSTPFHSPVAPRSAEKYQESLSDPDPRFVVAAAARRARSRWIVAVVLVGAGLLFGGTVGRKYLARFAVPEQAEQRAADARVATLVETGNQLLEDGDFEGAREQFAKASVLAEQDPAVLAAVARLETVRADFVWLELRLLDPADQERVRLTRRQLGARAGRARAAVEAASEVAPAPADPHLLRARVDRLRLAGKVRDARRMVGPLSQDAGEPENAYVLAALDLAETSPAWPTVIERLRLAASAEGKLGRARAMLIYALVRSGNLAQARSQLNKLEAMDKTHPLAGLLHAFIGRFESVAEVSPEAGAGAAAADASQPGSLASTAAAEGAPPAGDFRSQLEVAGRALRTGDLDRAERLYRAVLDKQPRNTEALAGLADVARMRNDSEAAGRMYDRVLEQNPSYVPALAARADQKWAAGDRAGAIVLYRRILEQAGPGTPYGQRAASRIAQGAGAGTPSGAGAQSSAQPTPNASPPPQPPAARGPAGGSETPYIDTTDLPELGR